MIELLYFFAGIAFTLAVSHALAGKSRKVAKRPLDSTSAFNDDHWSEVSTVTCSWDGAMKFDDAIPLNAWLQSVPSGVERVFVEHPFTDDDLVLPGDYTWHVKAEITFPKHEKARASLNSSR